MTSDSRQALDAALTEAEHYNSSWAKLDVKALRQAVDEHAAALGKLAAVRAVRVIDGEFVDADELYRALGEPKPDPARLPSIDERLLERWREHALDLAEQIRELRRQIAGCEAEQRTMTDINNLQVAEIRRLRSQLEVRHFRYVVTHDGMPETITILCAQCWADASLSAEEAVVVRLGHYEATKAWPWTLEQLNTAAARHETAKHGATRKRRRRPHNRAARRAQERDNP